MRTRKIAGHEVGCIGLGAMSFGGMFGATNSAASHRCLDAADDHGLNFIDTANVYGAGVSETVVGEWIRKTGKRPVLATKGGIVRDVDQPVNNSTAYLRGELEGSLKRLGVDHVALYYAHRRDPAVPPEELAGTMGRFIDEGLIGGYGLSEVAPATIARAHAERPVAAVQSEYSLWTRLPELGVIQLCAREGIAFVPFSPLARGVFGDGYPAAQDAFRAQIPRFSAENYPRNKAAIEPFKGFARDSGWTVPAMALAWVLNRGDHLIPIPGTRTAEHLTDWVMAGTRDLTAAERDEIDRLLPPGFAHGDRYSDGQWRSPEMYS